MNGVLLMSWLINKRDLLLTDLLLASTRSLSPEMYEDLRNYFGLFDSSELAVGITISRTLIYSFFTFFDSTFLIKKRLNWTWRSIKQNTWYYYIDILARMNEKKNVQSALTKSNSFRKVFINRFFLHKNKNTLWSLLSINTQTLSQIVRENLLQK